MAAISGPSLEPSSGRSPFSTASAAVLDASRLEGVRALPAPDAITLALLSASDSDADSYTALEPVVSPPPGGGLAAQPPAQPPPPSPPPGAGLDPVDEALVAVDETVEEVEETIEDTGLIDEATSDDLVDEVDPGDAGSLPAL